MRIFLVSSLVCLMFTTACRSKEDDLASARSEKLKKSFIKLYLAAIPDLSDDKTQTLARTGLAIALSENKKDKEAHSLLDDALIALNTKKKSPELDGARIEIAKAYLMASAPERVVALLTQLKVSPAKTDLLLRLIDYYANAQDFELTEAVLAKLSGEVPKSAGQKRVLLAMIKSGKIDKALTLTGSLKVKEHINEVFLFSVKKRLDQGKRKAAARLVQSMEGGTARNKAQGALALALFRAKQKQQAQTQLDGIESIWIRAATRAEYSNTLYRARAFNSAKVEGDRAIAEVKEIAEKSVKEAAVENLADIFLQARRTREALELARLVQTKEGLVAVHSDLIETYALAGRFDETKKLLPVLVQTPLWGAEGIGRLAMAYAGANRHEEAFDTAAKIAIMEFRLPVLSRLVVSHSESGRTVTEQELTAFEAALKSEL